MSCQFMMRGVFFIVTLDWQSNVYLKDVVVCRYVGSFGAGPIAAEMEWEAWKSKVDVL